MRCFLKAFLFGLFAVAPTLAPAEVRVTMEKWPADLNTLSCDAFVKTPNGGWGLAGTIVVRSSNEVLTGNTYVKGNAVADIIKRKCGNSAALMQHLQRRCLPAISCGPVVRSDRPVAASTERVR